MAILWCDSFNSYGTTSDLSKGWGSNTGAIIDLTGGSDSSPCAKWNASTGHLGTTLYSTPSGTTIGGRFKFKRSATVTAVRFLEVGCQNSISTAGVWFMGVSNGGASGAVYVTLPNSASPLTSGTTNICDNAWHVIEFQVKASDTVGTIKVWIDGVLEINYGPADTFNGTAHATAPWTALGLAFDPTASWTAWIDDIVIFDGDGVSGNLRTADQPFGNIVIATLRPSGAGTTTQFTPSAGSNYQCVDEVAQNDGTDYVEATTSGFRDLYAMGNLGLSPTTVYGVVAKVFASNPGGLTISMKQTLKSGATTTANTATVANLIGDYKEQVYDLNPDGSVVWTGTTVDAVEQGFEVA